VELLADEKERAEHIMLVDLAATMSACLRLRSVQVNELMVIERFRTSCTSYRT